jgi:uncharacterized protein YndB with AHSA1/START domain
MNALTNPTTITAQPGTPFLDLEREFDASPEQLFRAATDPELIVQWYGPRKYAMRLDTWDVRPGGSYRFVHADDSDGSSHGFRGVYHQVVANELVIQTFEWEGAPNQVAIETTTYTDLGNGRTRLHTHSVFPSVEALEGAIGNGMEWGVRESMDRLAELVESN